MTVKDVALVVFYSKFYNPNDSKKDEWNGWMILLIKSVISNLNYLQYELAILYVCENNDIVKLDGALVKIGYENLFLWEILTDVDMVCLKVYSLLHLKKLKYNLFKIRRTPFFLVQKETHGNASEDFYYQECPPW